MKGFLFFMSFFKIDSPLMQFLTKIADLIILNLLWLLCCIPIITIGPATTALYHMTLHMLGENEESHVVMGFLKAFRLNFKKSLFIWILILAVFLIIFTNLFFILGGYFGDSKFMVITFSVPAILTVIICSYVFAYTSRYEDSIWVCIKNSLIIGLSNIFSTIAIIMLNAMPIILAFMSLSLLIKISILWVLLGFALTAFINSFTFKKIFTTIETRKTDE